MVVKGVLNTVAHLLKVALGEKKKSIARKRSNLAGEFPERVTGEVISAFSGVPLSSGELWELNNSLCWRQEESLLSARGMDAQRSPREPRKHGDGTLPHYKSASEPPCFSVD